MKDPACVRYAREMSIVALRAEKVGHLVTILCHRGTDVGRVSFLTLAGSVILAGMEPALDSSVKRHLFSIIIPVVVTSCWMPLQGATLERLSLDDMIGKSTAIVRGTVTDTWTAFTGRDIYTHYKIQVSERFKGPAQKTVEITVMGGTVGEFHQTVAGAPVLNRGAEFVFFLWTSSRGITWITGLTQGLFALPAASSTDPSSTDRMATRAANRELMLDAVTAHAVKDNAVSMKLSEMRKRIAAKAGPVVPQ
jgi:hypothetical protein